MQAKYVMPISDGAKAEFFARHVTADHGQVTWSDDSKREFPLSVSLEELQEHCSPFEYLVTKLLESFPKRSREAIKEIWVGDELWFVEQGALVDTAVLPY